MALWAPVPDPRAALEQAARARVARGPSAHAGAAAPAPPRPARILAVRASNGSGAPPPGAALDGGLVSGAAPGGIRSPAGADDLDAPVDLFDTPLAAELAAGSAVRSLADELGRGPRAVLLAVATSGGRETIVAGCRARGWPSTSWRTPTTTSGTGAPCPGAPADDLVDETAGWLVARVSRPATPAGGPAPAAPATGSEVDG